VIDFPSVVLSAYIAENSDRYFTSYEVMEMAGCSYRQLDYWVRTGLITALHLNDVGSGNLREWDRESVIEAVVISRLSRAGVKITLLAHEDIIGFCERFIDDAKTLIDDLEDLCTFALGTRE